MRRRRRRIKGGGRNDEPRFYSPEKHRRGIKGRERGFSHRPRGEGEVERGSLVFWKLLRKQAHVSAREACKQVMTEEQNKREKEKKYHKTAGQTETARRLLSSPQLALHAIPPVGLNYSCLSRRLARKHTNRAGPDLHVSDTTAENEGSLSLFFRSPRGRRRYECVKGAVPHSPWRRAGSPCPPPCPSARSRTGPCTAAAAAAAVSPPARSWWGRSRARRPSRRGTSSRPPAAAG